MEHLNEKVIELIKEIQDTFKDDPDLPEVRRDLIRVSKFLLSKQLKKFDDGKERDKKAGISGL